MLEPDVGRLAPCKHGSRRRHRTRQDRTFAREFDERPQLEKTATPLLSQQPDNYDKMGGKFCLEIREERGDCIGSDWATGGPC